MKKAKCIHNFLVEQCDGDGFTIENSDFFIYKDSVWDIAENKWRVVDGEVRLTSAEKDSASWVELSKEVFDYNFEIVC